jgi:hypothetical protein
MYFLVWMFNSINYFIFINAYDKTVHDIKYYMSIFYLN